jgi:hypothetical protein
MGDKAFVYPNVGGIVIAGSGCGRIGNRAFCTERGTVDVRVQTPFIELNSPSDAAVCK